jgi:hypothetical protein
MQVKVVMNSVAAICRMSDFTRDVSVDAHA